MPRFVLLTHECSLPSASHWDLMLEHAGVLLTWRLSQLPEAWRSVAPGVGGGLTQLEAERIADHRIAYLDYEGPISGNRGRVTRWDRGHYNRLEETTDSLRVELEGDRVRGVVELPIGRPTLPPE